MAEQKTRHGSCLCGNVRYTVTGPLDGITACHCTQCRKQSGHFYAAAHAANTDLHIDGKEHLQSYRASEGATRYFCQTCGSALFWQADGSDITAILAGSLDDDEDLPFLRNIYCKSKGSYYDIHPAPENLEDGSYQKT